MARTRVLAADDYAPVLNAVSLLLQDSFDIVGLASNGHSALELILKLQPDIAILDISMPGLNGLELATQLQQRSSNTKVVFLTTSEDSEILARCLNSGGSGYVLKMFMDTDLIPAIHDALAGRTFISPFSSQRPRR
jgi:DNA-binding NarL/FixJ family response regulator